MKQLPTKWIHQEFELTIIQRIGQVAIAEKRWREDIDQCKYAKGEEGLGGQLSCYEIGVIKQSPAGTAIIGGQEVSFEAKESWPTDTQWGTKGFTAKTITQALIKMDALVKAEKEELEKKNVSK